MRSREVQRVDLMQRGMLMMLMMAAVGEWMRLAQSKFQCSNFADEESQCPFHFDPPQ